MAAVGIIEDWTALGKDLETLLGGVVLVVMYLALVAMTGFSTRSFLKTGAAAVGGAVALAIVASQTVLSNKVEQEIEQDHTAQTAIVVRGDSHGGAQ